MSDGFIIALLLIILFFAVLFGVAGRLDGKEDGKRIGRRESEHAAVLAGHAEYYLNDKFERQWRWKEAR